ncbi:hypothetical protein LINGRAHAP2_LOCUS30021, partial [Linum grandiflorum]
RSEWVPCWNFRFAGLSVWKWIVQVGDARRVGALAEWEMLVDFISSLSPLLASEGLASVSWPLDRSGVFSVQSLRRHHTSLQFPGDACFPYKTIWVDCIPIKI